MAEDWTRAEVEAIVADYFDMLAAELRGEDYNKSAHRRALSPKLNGRSDGSIERKHQNITAALLNLGHPSYVEGYKPLGNFQALLQDIVAERLARDTVIAALVASTVDAAAEVPEISDLLSRLEEPPARPDPSEEARDAARIRPGIIDFVRREAENASLGRAGELFVVNFERARLVRAGKDKFAKQIEHVSVEQGDGAGYDIRSYEEDGRDRWIEVKTTSNGKYAPFYVTKRELMVSQQNPARYYLYRFSDSAAIHGCSMSQAQSRRTAGLIPCSTGRVSVRDSGR